MDQTALTQVSQAAFEVITPLLAVVGAWLAHKIVAIFEKKSGIDIPDKQEAKIDEWVEKGIYLAAEKSRKKVKEKTEKLSGPEKLEEAADFVLALVESRGWIDWSKDKIKSKIEASLGVHRANGGVPSLEEK